MSSPALFGLCAAALVGIGLYGLLVDPRPLRKILALNLFGAGTFLIFGVVSRRGAEAGAHAGLGGDPVPQAMVITGIVVAFAATGLAVALLLRIVQATGAAPLDPAGPSRGDATPNPLPNPPADPLADAADQPSGRAGDE